MSKQICIIIFLLSCKICVAQNLVPNPSFEGKVSCPDNQDQVSRLKFWFRPTSGTPDYFNQCSTSNFSDTPLNNHGFQQPHTGNAYIGEIMRIGSTLNWREYVEVKLLTPLIFDSLYYFEMYVCLSEGSAFSTDDIGAYFSKGQIGASYYYPLPVSPQINNSSGIIADTLNWTLVSGCFVANGGERYLTIGNFKNDSNTTYQSTNFGWYGEAYFFIDDIFLSLVTTCNTSINEYNESALISIFPNPFSENLTITTKTNQSSEITLYDITARILLQQTFTNSVSLNTAQLAKGIYLYEVRNKNIVIKQGKVIKD